MSNSLFLHRIYNDDFAWGFVLSQTCYLSTTFVVVVVISGMQLTIA